MIAGRWAEHEDQYLVSHPSMSNADIAGALNRSRQSVANRRVKLGIRYNNGEHYSGCTEDCFRCSYCDCLKPM